MQKSLAGFAMLLACVSAALGQGSLIVNGVTSATKKFSVSGTVVNAVTGAPVARALVQTGEQVALTDEQGKFQLEASQAYANVEAQKPGFFNEQELGRSN